MAKLRQRTCGEMDSHKQREKNVDKEVARSAVKLVRSGKVTLP